MPNETVIDDSVIQGIASYVGYLNNLRQTELMRNLAKILVDETQKIVEINKRNTLAVEELKATQNLIRDTINSHRGGDKGVHGFLAEFAETGISNARDILANLAKSTELLNDNGDADLLVNGHRVQVKFYNQLAKAINAAGNTKYQDMQMMFPKDQFAVMKQVMNGETPIMYQGAELSAKKIAKLRTLIENENNTRGMNFDKWAKAAKIDYSQSQKNVVEQVVSDEINDTKQQSAQECQKVHEDSKQKREMSRDNAKSSLREASKAAGMGALTQGGMRLAMFIYQKHKAGQEIWQFTTKDWRAAGLDTTQSALKGGITGYAIYGLTNVCHLAAPSAGALVSGIFGLRNAVFQLRTGAVDDDEFTNLVLNNVFDTMGAALGGIAGQILIPIPVIGALLGSLMVASALNLGKNILNQRECQLLAAYQAKIDNFTNQLDQQSQKLITELRARYDTIGDLQNYAFDIQNNISLKLASSVELAQVVGVAKERILHNTSEIDDFFLA